MGKPSDTLPVLTELARPGMAPGETPVAAAKVNYNGVSTPHTATLRAEMAAMDASIGVEGGEMPEVDPDTLVGFPAASKMAILVTTERLVLWGVGITGKPQKVLGSVPGRGIAEVHHGEVTFGPLVRIVLKSNASVDLEVAKGDDVDAFVAAIRALISS